MSEPNWWDDRTMPNDDGPDWERDAGGVLWQVDPRTGQRTRFDSSLDLGDDPDGDLDEQEAIAAAVAAGHGYQGGRS